MPCIDSTHNARLFLLLLLLLAAPSSTLLFEHNHSTLCSIHSYALQTCICFLLVSVLLQVLRVLYCTHADNVHVSLSQCVRCSRAGAAELGAGGGGPRASRAARARREEGARAALLEPERGPVAERHDPPLPGRRALQTRVSARQRARQRRTQTRHPHLRHPVRSALRARSNAWRYGLFFAFLLRITLVCTFRIRRLPDFHNTTSNIRYSYFYVFYTSYSIFVLKTISLMLCNLLVLYV